MSSKLSAAELIGTFWLVLGGCGSAVLAAGISRGRHRPAGRVARLWPDGAGPRLRARPISGGHFNPAVSFGLWAGGRFPSAQLVPYIMAQVIGAILAAGVLYLIASGKAGFDVKSRLRRQRLRRTTRPASTLRCRAGHGGG